MRRVDDLVPGAREVVEEPVQAPLRMRAEVELRLLDQVHDAAALAAEVLDPAYQAERRMAGGDRVLQVVGARRRAEEAQRGRVIAVRQLELDGHVGSVEGRRDRLEHGRLPRRSLADERADRAGRELQRADQVVALDPD